MELSKKAQEQLNDELRAKILACETPEEIIALAKEEPWSFPTKKSMPSLVAWTGFPAPRFAAAQACMTHTNRTTTLNTSFSFTRERLHP